MLTYLSPQLAVVSVAVFPPVAGIGMWFGRRMKKQQKGVQGALAASSAVAEEVHMYLFVYTEMRYLIRGDTKGRTLLVMCKLRGLHTAKGCMYCTLFGESS